MLDGAIFYWGGWILWIIVTFLMIKNRRRTWLVYWILLVIICSNMHVDIESYHISFAFLILLVGAMILHGKLSRQMYHIFISFTLMIGYIAIHFWEKDLPISLFIPKYVFISLLFTILTVFLTKGLYNRLMTGLVGMCFGELIYHLILASYGITITIGDMLFLDAIALFPLFIITLNIFQGKRKQKSYTPAVYDHQAMIIKYKSS